MGPWNSRLGQLSCLYFFILPPTPVATEKQNKTSNQIKQNKIKLSSQWRPSWALPLGQMICLEGAGSVCGSEKLRPRQAEERENSKEREEGWGARRQHFQRGQGRERGRIKKGGKEKEERRRKGGRQRQHKSGARRVRYTPCTPHPLPQLALATGQRADAPEKPSCRRESPLGLVLQDLLRDLPRRHPQPELFFAILKKSIQTCFIDVSRPLALNILSEFVKLTCKV
jgi:hypothetical protein